ncbi:unnamed protein product, partial [Closterium sp. NIES-65]
VRSQGREDGCVGLAPASPTMTWHGHAAMSSPFFLSCLRLSRILQDVEQRAEPM